MYYVTQKANVETSCGTNFANVETNVEQIFNYAQQTFRKKGLTQHENGRRALFLVGHQTQ